MDFKKFNVTTCSDNPTLGLLIDCYPDGSFLLHQFSQKNSFSQQDTVDLKKGDVSFVKSPGAGNKLRISSEDLSLNFVYDAESGWRASYDDEVVQELWMRCQVESSDPLQNQIDC